MSVAPERIDALVEQLRSLSEEIADVALDLLHQALSDPDPKASPAATAEKVVTRARRSVEKAEQLLRGLERADEVE